MIPRTYVNLRVNPHQEHEVLGQYVGEDGVVSEQWYLVAVMSGNPVGRRHAAIQLAASERIRRAAQEAYDFIIAAGECATDEELSDFLCNNGDKIEDALREVLEP